MLHKKPNSGRNINNDSRLKKILDSLDEDFILHYLQDRLKGSMNPEENPPYYYMTGFNTDGIDLIKMILNFGALDKEIMANKESKDGDYAINIGPHPDDDSWLVIDILSKDEYDQQEAEEILDSKPEEALHELGYECATLVDQLHGKPDMEPWICDNEECEHEDCIHHPDNGTFDECDECDACCGCCDDDEYEEDEDEDGSLDISLSILETLTEGCSVLQQNLTTMLMEISRAQNRLAKAVYDEANEDDDDD